MIQQNIAIDPVAESFSGNQYSAIGDAGIAQVDVLSRNESLSRWASQDEPTARDVASTYVDPSASAASYGSTLGNGASIVGLARTQSSQDWNESESASGLVAYEQAGFQEAGAAPRNWLPPSPPSASASLPPSVSLTTDSTTLTFSVTFTSTANQAVDISSIGNGNIVLLTPAGKPLPASLQSVSGGGSAPVVANYQFTAPRGAWRTTDSGKYTLLLQGGQVQSTDGFIAARAVLGGFSLHVAQAPLPPRARSVLFVTGGRTRPQSLRLRFSSDVGSTLNAGALVLTDGQGNAVAPALMNVSYEPISHTATWTFPGLINGRLAAGAYHVRLLGSVIADVQGRHLDGNGDGIGGDDLVWGGIVHSR